jgi:ribosome assembly protein YihI (activator of Der GTPase)
MYGSQRKDNPKHPLLHLYLHLPTIRHKESIQKKVHENIFVKETPSGSQKKIWVILEERITKSDNPRTKKKKHTEKKSLGSRSQREIASSKRTGTN